MERLKFGVIGMGFIGFLHARIINEIYNAELVAVADTDKEVLEKATAMFGCKGYENYEDMLVKADIEAVSVCTPDQFHLAPSVAVARAGKHLLCEKPIATTVKEANAIREACKQAGVGLMVAHVLRFDPRYVRLHDEIARGELGEIIHLRCKRHNGRGIVERLRGRISMLFYIGIHDIDIIQWFTNSKITKVYAQKVAKVNSVFGSDDCIFVLANLASGAIASLEFSWSLPKNFPAGIYANVEAIGSKGAGYVDILEQGVRLYKEHDPGFEYPDTLHWPETNGRIMGDLRDEIEHFTDAVQNGKKFLVSNDDAVSAVAVIEAICMSLDSGMPVEVKG